MPTDVDAFVAGFQHFCKLLGKNERFVFYLEVALAKTEDLRALLSSMSEFNRTMGGDGYIYNLLDGVMESADGRQLHQIEAVPVTLAKP